MALALHSSHQLEAVCLLTQVLLCGVCSAVRYKTSGPDVIADPRPKVEKDTGINVAQYVQVRCVIVIAV